MPKKENVKEAKVVKAAKEESKEVETTEEETTEVKEQEEVKEVKEEPKKKEKKDNDVLKVVLKRTWDIIFWSVIALVLVIWIVDFINVKQSKDAIFCVKKETIQMENGTVDSCLGLGYKVYTYHTSNYEGAREFGPFWNEPRK